MIPPSFDYHAPDTLAEAISLLDQYGGDAKVLSGGQSLLPLLKLRLAAPAHLVDIGRATWSISLQVNRLKSSFEITVRDVNVADRIEIANARFDAASWNWGSSRELR